MPKSLKIIQNNDIAILVLNRPKSLNALSLELAQSIIKNLIKLDANKKVRGIVITGAGERAFCAGVDLNEALRMKPSDIEGWFGTICNIYRQILMTNKPVITALNGIAAGGGFQIALVSDLRVSHSGTKLGQPEINAGIPSIMGSYWISLHLGWSKNQELSMTGQLLTNEEAHKLGLINFVVEKENVVETACEVATMLANKPSAAWAGTKARFRKLALEGFDEALQAGILGQKKAYESGEPQAIIESFLKSRRSKSS